MRMSRRAGLLDSGKCLIDAPVGSVLKLNETIGGVTTAQQFLIISHGYYYTWATILARRYLFESPQKWDNTEPSSFDGSDIKTWLTNTYYNYFDQSVKDKMQWTMLPIGEGAASAAPYIFTFSGTELGFSAAGMEDYQDSAIPYFAGSAQRVFKTEGGVSGLPFWTRSIDNNNANNVFISTATGSLSTAAYNTSNWVLPALQLSSATPLADELDAQGHYTLL